MRWKGGYDLVMGGVASGTAVFKHDAEGDYDCYGPRAKITLGETRTEYAPVMTAGQRLARRRRAEEKVAQFRNDLHVR